MSLISNSTVQTGDLTRPRILCLHGGGSNAKIFRAQCRAITKELDPYFCLVFADAPFPSDPGPDVTTVYHDFGPFRRWLRSDPLQPYLNAAAANEEIEQSLLTAVKESDRQGATGAIVGLMGFSQGAKLAASLLLRQQLQTSTALSANGALSAIRFAILMAGRAPLVSFGMYTDSDPAFLDTSQYSVSLDRSTSSRCRDDHILRLPTVHVHGLRDPGLLLHKALLEDFCGPESTVVEWNGLHRVPIKTVDVVPVIDAILDVAQATGCLY